MITLATKETCTGCSACASICPKGAISMKADFSGCLYPEINEAACVNCLLCQKACPVINAQSLKHAPLSAPRAYAAYNLNEEIRLNSSSGGVFTSLAEQIIKQGGTVVGAASDENQNVRHIAVNSINELNALRGSKYVQSEIGKVYKQTKELLNNNKPVLFTGAPCQIEGLLSYLGKTYNNLYTQDLICHGTPCPRLWQKYVSYREALAKAKASRTFFRHKFYGWKKYSILFVFTNKIEYLKPLTEDLYLRLFLSDVFLRPSCYNCAFKKENRKSDITLADFWGCQDICPELDDNKGLSLVIVHSKKGQELLEKCKSSLKIKEVSFADAVLSNPAITTSAKMPKERQGFIENFDKLTLEELAERYIPKPSLKMRIKRKIASVLPNFLLNFYKKLRRRHLTKR